MNKSDSSLICPHCGGEIIVKFLVSAPFLKYMFMTDNGWEEVTDKSIDEFTCGPTYTKGTAFCNKCHTQFHRHEYEIVCDDNQNYHFIVLNKEEKQMTSKERYQYFLSKGLKPI